jgi:hypothetical protein
MNAQLPTSVAQALGGLVQSLQAEGFVPAFVGESASFGDFTVEFSDGRRQVLIVRDRGQLMVQGERSVLEPADLWRAFDGWRSLQQSLIPWIHSTAT